MIFNKLKFTILGSGILIIVLIGVLVYFYNDTSETANRVVVSTAENSIPPVGDETKNYVRGYASELFSYLNLNGDPFDLTVADISTLNHIQETLASTTVIQPVVFNGRVYDGLEGYWTGDVFYLKPKRENTIPPSQYLKIVEKKIISPAEFYNNIPGNLQREMYELAYVDLINGVDEERSVARLKEYLETESQKGESLKKYEYSEVDKTFYLYVPDLDFPLEIRPRLYAENMRFIIDSFADPAGYLNDLVFNYNQRLSAEEVLIVNTTASSTFMFMNRSGLQRDLNTLLNNDRDVNEILTDLADSIRFDGDGSDGDGLVDHNYDLRQELAVQALLDRSGVIVPPSKKINYIQGADYYRQTEIANRLGQPAVLSTWLQNFRSVGLTSFTGNDYYVNTVRFAWNEKAVEKIAKGLSDKTSNITVMYGHGSLAGSVLVEVWDFGPRPADMSDESQTADFWQRYRQFSDRLTELQTNFPDEIFSTGQGESTLSVEQAGHLRSYTTSLDTAYQFLTDAEPRMVGLISVNNKFFSKHNSKKSLFFLISCYGGNLFEGIKSRVFLASAKDKVTFADLFFSDLKKIDKYLFKQESPGPWEVTLENLRNFSITKSFTITDAGFQGVLSNADLAKCDGQEGVLCTLKPEGIADQTVAVSPHVQKVTADTIEFNAPMAATGRSAPGWVTVDASQCASVDEQALNEIPEWDRADGFGDKVLKLPWLDKIYRNWQTDDFGADGSPKGPWVKITVHNDQAVSAISRINLTGNPDCFTDTALHPECWKKPDTIKYNGNQPKTDFTYALPCVDNEPEINLACMSNILEERIINHPESQVMIDRNGTHKVAGQTKALFLNGKVIESCIEKTVRNYNTGLNVHTWCTEPVAFGSHVAWLEHTNTSSVTDVLGKTVTVLMYNNKPYDQSELISGLFLYRDSVLYLKYIDGQAYVTYNKKNYGELLSLKKQTSPYLQLPDFKFDLTYNQLAYLNFFYTKNRGFDSQNRPTSDQTPVFETTLVGSRSGEVKFEYEYDKVNYQAGRVYGVPMGYLGTNLIMETDVIGEHALPDDGPNQTAVYVNGKFYPINNVRNVTSWAQLRDVFGSQILFTVETKDDNEDLYRDGTKIATGKNIYRATMFGDNFAFFSLDDYLVNYNGKILTKIDSSLGSRIILYQDSIAYRDSDEQVYFDGKKYNYVSSILLNMYACRQDYMAGL